MTMTAAGLDGFLREVGSRRADAVWLHDCATGRRVTYAELVPRLAALGGLIPAGAVASRRPMLLQVASPSIFKTAFLALLCRGIQIVPIAPDSNAQTVATIAVAANAAAVLTDQAAVDSSRSIERVLVTDDRLHSMAGAADGGPRSEAAGDEAVILYTSGTTGVPKGIRLSLENLLANAADIGAALGAKDSRFLSCLPLYHTNAQIFNLLVPLLSASSVYCMPEYSLLSLSGFWRVIEEHRIEFVDVVPTIIHLLLRLRPTSVPDTSSIKYIVCGAAPVDPGTLERFEALFSVKVLQEYGLSEATCTSAMERPDQRRRGTVGCALPGNVVEIRDAQGRSLPAGQAGEIWIRGNYNMRGYVGRVDGYGLSVRDGWLLTGDIGSLDGDGFLTISGRIKHVIKKGGQTIIPEDIEKLLSNLPQVVDVAAVGSPDEAFGEVIDLYVVLRDGAGALGSVARLCREQLPKAWRPRRVIPVEEIPRTASGKIRRQALRELQIGAPT